MSDIRDLLHGMQSEAGMGAEAPDALRTKIHRVARRRRATREVAGGSLAVVTAGVLAWGVVRIGDGGEGEVAGPSPSSSPTASASATPTPTAVPTGTPEAAPGIDLNAFPWNMYVPPELTPATQEAADAALDPVAGPTLSIGVLEPATHLKGWEGVDCSALGEGCGRTQAPPVSRGVLDRVTPGWTVISDLAYLRSAPERPAGALYLASPEGEMFTLFDVAALEDELQLPSGFVTDVALDPDAGTLLMVHESESDAHPVVLVDLTTGATTVVARSDSWATNVERDGDGWLVWGTYGSEPFAARLAPDATSWDVSDMWAVRDGTVERAGGHLVVRSGDGFLLSPQSDLSLVNLTAPRVEGEQCTVARATEDGLLTYCAVVDEESVEPAFVTWNGSRLAAPDAPVLPDVPLKRWAFALGDGYLEITPYYADDNAPVADGTPDYEWHRPGGTESIDGPASSGAVMSTVDGEAVWVRHESGLAVIDSEGQWRDLMDWSDGVSRGFTNLPQVLDIGY